MYRVKLNSLPLRAWLVVVSILLLSTPTFSQDCGCQIACTAAWGECVGGGVASCVASCRNGIQLATARAELRSEMVRDLDTVVPAYMNSVSEMRKASSFSDLVAKFSAYQKARSARDLALVRQYATINVVGLLTDGGKELDAIDDAYKMPAYARPNFHSFAWKYLKSMLSGKAIFGSKDAMAAFDNNGYTFYSDVVDSEELKSWSNPKGLPTPKLAFGQLIEVKKGDWKTLSELTPAEMAIKKACSDESLQANSTKTREGIEVRQRVYANCIEKCQTCRW